MQKNGTSVEENSIEQMNRLLSELKIIDPTKTEDQLAVDLGYNGKYFSQSRSRGEAPQKLLSSLERYVYRLRNITHIDKEDKGNKEPFIIIDRLSLSNDKLSESILNYSEAAREGAIAARLQAENTKMIVEQNKDLIGLLRKAFSERPEMELGDPDAYGSKPMKAP